MSGCRDVGGVIGNNGSFDKLRTSIEHGISNFERLLFLELKFQALCFCPFGTTEYSRRIYSPGKGQIKSQQNQGIICSMLIYCTKNCTIKS